MKSLIIFVLLVAAVQCVKKEPLLTKEFVDDLNRRPGMTWKAGHENGVVTGATKEQLQRLLGARIPNVNYKNGPIRRRVFTKSEIALHIPPEFDAAKAWPNCKTISRIDDHSSCHSSWAVAAAAAISDRYCTLRLAPSEGFRVSASNILSCSVNSTGCDREAPDPRIAWEWWISKGIVSEECQPYPFPKCTHHVNSSRSSSAAYHRAHQYPDCEKKPYPTPKCEHQCNNTAVNATLYKGRETYYISGTPEFQIELMTRGPFQVTFVVYEDFFAYKSGVYQHLKGDAVGYASAKLVGWGTTNEGAIYWKVANSWNEEWGNNGYFLIGENQCFILSAGIAGF